VNSTLLPGCSLHAVSCIHHGVNQALSCHDGVCFGFGLEHDVEQSVSFVLDSLMAQLIHLINNIEGKLHRQWYLVILGNLFRLKRRRTVSIQGANDSTCHPKLQFVPNVSTNLELLQIQARIQLHEKKQN